MQTASSHALLRNTLGTLLLLTALNALGGGMYGMLGANEIPRQWIEGTLFPDYFIPSAFLFVVIGGTSLFSAILVFKQLPYAKKAAFLTSMILLVWIIIQVILIGFVSFLQPVIGLVALAVLALSFVLH